MFGTGVVIGQTVVHGRELSLHPEENNLNT
jgi:hypothetical protein